VSPDRRGLLGLALTLAGPLGSGCLFTDPSPKLAHDSAETPPPFGEAGIVLNEVMPGNESTVMTEDLRFSDWVELLNLGGDAIEFDRVSLSIDGEAPWRGPSGVEFAPGEHVLVWADAGEGAFHAPFSLSRKGERLELGLDGDLVDRIDTGPMAADVSWARFPDGGAWLPTGRPSPGWSNGSQPGPLDPTEDIFQLGRTQEIRLWISDSAWAALNTDTDPDPAVHQNLEVSAAMAFGPAWFPEVGVHIKGAWGSRRSMEQKVALKLNLDAFEEHRLRGLESVTLNNMVQDLSYVHEYLAYALFRAAGIPAPRVAWTRLYLNDEFRGLYLWVESEDDPFLERWYADPSGSLYEGAYGVDFYSGYESLFEHEEGPDPAGRPALTAIAACLDGEATDEAVVTLDTLLDLDQFLLNMAIEVLTLHWDGYTTSNNYRLYQDPLDGRFDILPWGTDQTFVSYSYGPWGGWGRVFAFCVSNDACRRRYDRILLETIDLMESLALDVMLDEALSVLEDDIAEDAWREYGVDYVTWYQDYTREMITTWPASIRAQVE
jgi:hypothetical protein